MSWDKFEGKQVVVLGLARQGLALARYLTRMGANVTINDVASARNLQAEITALNGLPVELVLEGHPLTVLDNCDLLCISGGVSMQLPIVQEAVARGIPLSNDSLLTMQICRQQQLGPIIGITGSSGKTTTTTLVGEMLKASGQTAHVGGNIGIPLIDRLQSIGASEPIVFELSSFQLEPYDTTLAYGPVDNIGPDIVAITNITPNHLDRHENMATYVQAKLNILSSIPKGSMVILNADDVITAQLLGDKATSQKPPPSEWKLKDVLAQAKQTLQEKDAQVFAYSINEVLSTGGWREDGVLKVDDKTICRQDELQLRGEHNVSNVLVAAVISCAAYASPEAIHDAAVNFTGVPHRLEVVAQEKGVTWINDSIATSPERAVAALRSIDPEASTLILLAGGKDKHLPWTAFAGEAISRVSMLIGFGDAGPMIVEAVQEYAASTARKAPNCATVRRLDEAIDLAARVAQPNSVVLLSPGGTSYDAYKDFEDRGEHFRQLVKKQARIPTYVNGTDKVTT